MKDYLIDREILAQFADQLIKQKAPNFSTKEEFDQYRERAISALDHYIGYSIFSSLSDQQLTEFNQLLDQEGATEADFRNFFDNASVDLPQVIAAAVSEFNNKYLGGNHA